MTQYYIFEKIHGNSTFLKSEVKSKQYIIFKFDKFPRIHKNSYLVQLKYLNSNFGKFLRRFSSIFSGKVHNSRQEN